MGAGNVCVLNEYEGLYYLDNDFLDYYHACDDVDAEPKSANELRLAGIEYNYDGKDCGWRYDEYESRFAYSEMVEDFKEYMTCKFPSFTSADEWLTRDRHVILENKLFYIALADNQWSVAFLLLERMDDWGFDESKKALKARHFSAYLDAVKDYLLDTYGECCTYSGPWTSGRILKNLAAA